MLGNFHMAIGALMPFSMLLQAAVLPPVLILILCVIAGVGTVMLLPSRREASLRKIGGVVVLSAGLILVAMLVRHAAGEVSAGEASGGGMGIYFWFFSAITIVGALRVITHPRPVYSAMYFVLTVLASAGLFVLLWAEFMAMALVLLYAGAILVTYVFVIMLASEASTPHSPGNVLAEYDTISREPVAACAVGFAMMGILLFIIFDKAEGLPDPVSRGVAEATASVAEDGSTTATVETGAMGATRQLGRFVFGQHIVSLELAGLILTVAMIGAIVIAKRRIVAPAVAIEPESITAPMTPHDDNPHSIPVYGTDNPRQKEYPET